MPDSTGNQRLDRLTTALSEAVEISVREAVTLGRLEEFFDPKPASLYGTAEQREALQSRVDRLVEAFGGPPRLFIVAKDATTKPRYDTYLASALAEAIAVFYRARRSVTRAQMFMVAAHMQREHPDVLPVPDEHFRQQMQQSVDGSFWEHAETSFIRIASFWDRVGQILDFVHFRIRQFERDGFAAVVDRVHTNVVPVRRTLGDSVAWQAVRRYRNSEQEGGLKWLLRRRNLVVHSLHLRPIGSNDEGSDLFEAAFNHLDERVRKDLATGDPTTELRRLHMHLSAAADLFPHILTICEQSSTSDD